MLVAGCSKLTAENYDKIALGMDKVDVEAILGQADRCDDTLGTQTCVWGDDNIQIKVAFAGDKAMLYSSKGLEAN
ncbi:hypothetical protein GCM10023333_33920 [Ferrimonas pelagia]|uniref:DUF3862 domain-containing protein n=2 Tax=Ferrimonas pelagia TaxID=1177826 RepID=A0ABP9FAG7_9GAMM